MPEKAFIISFPDIFSVYNVDFVCVFVRVCGVGGGGLFVLIVDL